MNGASLCNASPACLFHMARMAPLASRPRWKKTVSMNSTDRLDILGCVLAGGLSSRMGGSDKAFVDFHGRPLIAHVAERLSSQVAATIINANDDSSRFTWLGLPVIPDTINGHIGPLGGILAAMRYAASERPDMSHVISAAVDTPFFPLDLASRLGAASRSPDTIVLAASAGRIHPVFGLWPVSLADELERWLATSARRSVLAWCESRSSETVTFEAARSGDDLIDPFLNINTPEELERALRLRPRPS